MKMNWIIFSSIFILLILAIIFGPNAWRLYKVANLFDKKTISKIKKLLITKDLEKVDLGLELLRALDKTEVYETLLFDCKIFILE